VKILSPRGPLGLFCDHHHLVMKLVGKHIDKTGAVGFFFTFIISDILSNAVQGYVKLRPEDDEDMWHLYNIIQNVSSATRLLTSTLTMIS